MSYHAMEERLDHGDCSASAQSSIHGGEEGDRRRLGVPGSGVAVSGSVAAAAGPRDASRVNLPVGRHREAGCGRGGPYLWTPQLISVHEQDGL